LIVIWLALRGMRKDYTVGNKQGLRGGRPRTLGDSVSSPVPSCCVAAPPHLYDLESFFEYTLVGGMLVHQRGTFWIR